MAWILSEGHLSQSTPLPFLSAAISNNPSPPEITSKHSPVASLSLLSGPTFPAFSRPPPQITQAQSNADERELFLIYKHSILPSFAWLDTLLHSTVFSHDSFLYGFRSLILRTMMVASVLFDSHHYSFSLSLLPLSSFLKNMPSSAFPYSAHDVLLQYNASWLSLWPNFRYESVKF